MTKKSIILSSLIMMVIFFSIFSCTKETKFGYDILPNSDKFQHLITDTVTVEFFTQTDDSVVVSQVTNFLAGSYNDPVFGQHSASFLCQFRLSTLFTLSPTYIPDSVVLCLYYNKNKEYLGDSSQKQTLNVHIASTFADGDTVHYAWETNEYNTGQLIGSKNFSADTLTHLNIKLDDSFAQTLMQESDVIFGSEEKFKAFLPGIYVTPANPNVSAAIYSFNPQTDTLKFYYHKPENPENQIVEIFLSNDVSSMTLAHMNFFEHQYETTEFFSHLNSPTISSNIAYIQGMSGLRTRISFPYIEQWQNLKDSFAIHRAELILASDESTDNAGFKKYLPPSVVYINPLDTTGLPMTPGILRQIEGDYEYHFDMADYVSGIMKGTIKNTGIVVSAFNSSRINNRVTFSTSGNAKNKSKFIITYSKLPK